MVGILFATFREAEPFLTRIRARPTHTGKITCYDANVFNRTCTIAVSGMGKVAAAVASGYLVNSCGATTLISAGLCGLLHSETGGVIGDLFRVAHAVEGDCDRFGKNEQPVGCDLNWFAGMKTAGLVTCDQPVFDTTTKSTLAILGDLIDMEGAAVARVADFYKIECAMIKGVSDDADEKGKSELAANMDWVSARIAAALTDEVNKQLLNR